MSEPVRFSWQHWWNFVFLTFLILGVASWLFMDLDGRFVLLAIVIWIGIGMIFTPAIIHEHIGFFDRWIAHDYSKANLRYRKAVMTGKATAQAYSSLASLTLAEGDTAEAARLMEEAIRRIPQDGHAHGLLSITFARLGRVEEAISEGEKCKEFLGESCFYYYVLGNAMRAKGEDTAAVSAYQKAVEMCPRLLRARLSLGEMYLRRGEIHACEIQFRQAMKISPNNPDVCYWMGQLAFVRGYSKEARNYLHKALQNRPIDDHSYLVPYKELVKSLAYTNLAVFNLLTQTEG